MCNRNILPPEFQKGLKGVRLVLILWVLRRLVTFLTVSGMEQHLTYQIIFRNLTKVAGLCAMCGANTDLLFVSSFEFVCPESVCQKKSHQRRVSSVCFCTCAIRENLMCL